MMNFAREVIDAATALREADNGFVSSPHLELLYRAVDNLKVQKQRSVQTADLRGLLPPEYVRVYELTDRVVEQAALVVASYERHNGYTAGLSINLQRLSVVVREWRAYLAQLQLDSDSNGFDRWEGYNNEQTKPQTEVVSGAEGDQRAQAQAERGAGGDAASERKPPHRSPSSASVSPRREGDS